MDSVLIRRRFFDLPGRQIHYRRRGGEGLPLIALHHLPGSARQLEPLLTALSGATVLAPDMAGVGDSDPYPLLSPSIADYAADTLALIDGLALDEVDLYGCHTGACIAAELAARHPHRVRRIILDGVPLFDARTAEALASSYAPTIAPDINGAHLLWAHNFCRDQILFWPWYERTAAAARCTGLPPARDLHGWVLEVIKGLEGIPQAYRAAFSFAMADRLTQVGRPTLCISAQTDTLAEASRLAVDLLPDGRLALVKAGDGGLGAPAEIARVVTEFLAD